MKIPRFVSIRTSLLPTIILCSLLTLAIACGSSTDSTATEPPPAPDPTATQAPAATDVPDEEPEPTAPPTTLDTSDRGWNVLGSPDALVTVLDYSDFQ